jgi:uridine monophosphate synthetase
LKSGIQSPIYIDLRLIVSYPQILRLVGNSIWEKIMHLQCDLVCGVPYTALPIATAISLQTNVPMIMRRKEIKDYGTRKCVEGAFRAGQHCVVIEDLVTSGISVMETVDPLRLEHLIVKDVAVLIDREQGARQNLADRGITLHAVTTISELLHVLQQEGKITNAVVSDVLAFVRENQTTLAVG